MTKQLEAIRLIAAQPLASVSGPMLTIGELRLLFPSPELPKDESIRQVVMPAVQTTGTPQLGSVVSNFVQAFQRLAEEWQSAFAPAASEAATA
jgi:hypothetical protein